MIHVRMLVFLLVYLFGTSGFLLGQSTDYRQERIVRENYTTLEASLSGFEFQYDKEPIGNHIGLGYKFGIARQWALSKKQELFFKADYSQLNNNYFRIRLTGVLDTINTYNSVKIYQENNRLHYINSRFGLRSVVWANNSINLYAGFNVVGGLLIGAKTRGHDLYNSSKYVANAISSYRRFNYGIELELSTRFQLVNNDFFFMRISYEIGIPNIYKVPYALPQNLSQSQYTRVFLATVSFPIFSNKKLQP